MDTWATSSLTPLLNTHLIIGQDDPAVAARHAQVFPCDLRPQAHDIIRTWAFYTITKAFFHFGQIPWKDIVISGHAQDVGGKKISKSKGHVVTPAEMVQKYTADGLRYWSSSCKLGTDTLYDEKLLGEGKRLITKLFNASKFALKPPAGLRSWSMPSLAVRLPVRPSLAAMPGNPGAAGRTSAAPTTEAGRVPPHPGRWTWRSASRRRHGQGRPCSRTSPALLGHVPHRPLGSFPARQGHRARDEGARGL